MVPFPSLSFKSWLKRATDQDHDAEEQWPPDHGWHFCSAEAAFRGVTFVVNGKPWLLLKLLANRVNRPVSVKELLQEIDPNADIGVESLRTHLSRTLRPILKKAFHLREGVDPIPNLGRGVLASWKIDESVFPTVTEIQRWRNEDATRL